MNTSTTDIIFFPRSNQCSAFSTSRQRKKHSACAVSGIDNILDGMRTDVRDELAANHLFTEEVRTTQRLIAGIDSDIIDALDTAADDFNSQLDIGQQSDTIEARTIEVRAVWNSYVKISTINQHAWL